MPPRHSATLVPRPVIRPRWAHSWKAIYSFALFGSIAIAVANGVRAEEAARPGWTYSEEQLRPFWEGETMEGESVLFIKDPKTGEARASVLFPIRKVLSVRSSTGEIPYEEGRDFTWKPGSREIVIPPGSRVITSTSESLRRPAKSQPYRLTHRDGNGEIYFGGKLEYHQLQTIVSYSHAPNLWTSPVPKFDPKALPRSVHKLLSREPLKIVVLGDSISTGCNASGWADGKPFQPAYPDLIGKLLHEKYKSQVGITNLSVGGMDSAWGLTMVGKVVEAEPDLVLLAFGMNDSAGRPAQDFQDKIAATMKGIRKKRPQVEFILVATMVGNPGWVALKQELFPAYRDALAKLCGPGVALADVTSIWGAFLRLKQDWDQTGNGVNHPNDFGHRVYAQVIATLVIPNGEPANDEEPARIFESGPVRLGESRLLHNYTYSYAVAVADLDGDGRLDLTSADAEPNSNVYLLRNQGAGKFVPSFIQKYAKRDEQPVRVERHAIGDINRDGRPDVVIVDNMKWDIRWFENPGGERIGDPWKLHRVSAPQEVPGSYDVALADLDGDGDLDVAASSWRYGNRFDWFENAGRPGNGESWIRHEVDANMGETRTIAIGDINRDGKPDLLGTARTGNQVVWYANPGDPARQSWKKTLIDGQTQAPAHGHPVDLDGDGDLDVVMAFGIAAGVSNSSPDSHQVAWYENVGTSGDGTRWEKHGIAASFPQGFEAVAGDLDGDGDRDVVATGWGPEGRIAWFENPGDPKAMWKPHPIKDRWPNAVTLQLADLDGDGRLDIVACAERGANELRWWRNLGTIDPGRSGEAK